MAVDVFAADEQTDRPVDLERWTHLVRSVLADQGVVEDAEVSLLFVDEGAIGALNERFLGRTGPTDVLAFPLEQMPIQTARSSDFARSGPGAEKVDVPLALLGDVVICPAVAAANATIHESTYQDEMALLVVHGLLHLLGMDHEDEAEADAMERLERTLLGRFYLEAPSGAEPEQSSGPDQGQGSE